MKERYIETPNLPQGRVTLVGVGAYPQITEALEKEGISTLSFSSNILPAETARHTDMLLCHIGGYRVFAVPSINTGKLTAAGFSVYQADEISAVYPDDVKVNAAVGCGYYIYNPETIDTNLNEELILNGFIGIPVKQGYSKCSVCFVTEKAIITEDPSIYRALQKTSCDTLLISQGDIFLSEKHYGFFGGSSGKISKDTLAVTGELKYHRDGDRIIQFCKAHGVKIKELIKGRLIDIGGIIPLLEKR